MYIQSQKEALLYKSVSPFGRPDAGPADFVLDSGLREGGKRFLLHRRNQIALL